MTASRGYDQTAFSFQYRLCKRDDSQIHQANRKIIIPPMLGFLREAVLKSIRSLWLIETFICRNETELTAILFSATKTSASVAASLGGKTQFLLPFELEHRNMHCVLCGRMV
jgi:hypothetical protein